MKIGAESWGLALYSLARKPPHSGTQILLDFFLPRNKKTLKKQSASRHMTAAVAHQPEPSSHSIWRHGPFTCPNQDRSLARPGPRSEAGNQGSSSHWQAFTAELHWRSSSRGHPSDVHILHGAIAGIRPQTSAKVDWSHYFDYTSQHLILPK